MTIDFAGIQERLNQATKGVWQFDRNGLLFARTPEKYEQLILPRQKGALTMKWTDQDFIQHAKTDLLNLIAATEAFVPTYEMQPIQERLTKATPGTWKFGNTGILHSTEDHKHIMYANDEGSVEISESDMRFLENAKTDIRTLLGVVQKKGGVIA